MAEFLKIDTERRDPALNKLVLDTITGSILGFGAGIVLSVFLKNKSRMRAAGCGIGAGVAYEFNGGQLKSLLPSFKREKSSAQIPNGNSSEFWKTKPWLKYQDEKLK